MVPDSPPSRGLVAPVVLALAALALWNTFPVYPLRIFVVFLHEISHGLAAVVTGGSIVRIELTPEEGGLCVTRGGWRFLVLNAGYLGSLAWGALFLVTAARSERDRALVGGIGIFTLVVTLVYVRTLFGFGYGVLAGSALVLVAWKLQSVVSDLLLKTIGVVSCLYGVWDVFSDVLFRSVPGSDANALGQLTGIPGVAWGAAWIVIDLAVVALALRAASRA